MLKELDAIARAAAAPYSIRWREGLWRVKGGGQEMVTTDRNYALGYYNALVDRWMRRS